MVELKETAQLILEVLSEKTMTARDLFYRLRSRGLPTGLASVYQTLDELVQAQQVIKQDKNDRVYFMKNLQQQGETLGIEVHCSCCGGKRKIESERICDLLREEYQFEATTAELKINGICHDCQKEMSA